MAQQGEELYVEDILRGLEVPPDLLELAAEAEQNSFAARLRRVRDRLGVSPEGITQVRIPGDAGYAEILVAPAQLPGYDSAKSIERWIFTVPSHDPDDFTVDTTIVTDFLAIPDGEPLERIFGLRSVRPRIHRVEDFISKHSPHVEIGRLATDQVELYLGNRYEGAFKAKAIQSLGNFSEAKFLDKITGIPTSCAESIAGTVEVHDI